MLKASAGKIKWDGASDDRNAKGEYINCPGTRTCTRKKIRDDQRNGNHGAQRKENQNGHLGEGLDGAETLWLRPDLLCQVGSAARLIEKGVMCWLHVFRGLLLARPIRMFGEGRAVPA
jgi:hypothetical protein